MNKEFIPHQQALELKELGFDERCLAHYWEGLFYFQTTHHHPSTMPNSLESCLVPIYQQAFRWFREKYALVHNIHPITYDYYVTSQNDPTIGDIDTSNTYEEAELACLKKLIEIVKTK